MNLNIQEKINGITIECRVTPKSGKNAIKGIKDGVLLVSLNAPPIEGRANEALTKFMAGLLDIPRSNITIYKGEHSRNKVLYIEGIDKETTVSRLNLSDGAN